MLGVRTYENCAQVHMTNMDVNAFTQARNWTGSTRALYLWPYKFTCWRSVGNEGMNLGVLLKGWFVGVIPSFPDH